MRKRTAIPLVLFSCGWVVLAATTVVQRAPYACGPQLLSEGCLSAFWIWLGNVATFWWVDDWEALIGAMIALLAAGVGAYFISKQITQQDRIAADARSRKADSYRAVLPLALSQLHDHVTNTVEQLLIYRSALVNRASPAIPVAHPTLPAVPSSEIAVLQGIIEFSDDVPAREDLMAALRELQVLHARLSRIAEAAASVTGHIRVSEMDGLFLPALNVFGRINRLFSYARDGTSTRQPVSEFVWTATRLLNLDHPQHFQQLHRDLRRLHGNEPAHYGYLPTP